LSSRVRRILIAVGLLLALGLVVGVAAGDRLSGGDDDGTRTNAVATTPAAETDPYPLATGPTPRAVQDMVFERAYSECATGDPLALAAKYKTEDTSDDGVAEAVGRGWASYFKAGSDAAQEGRDGCLQAMQEGSN